MAFKLSLLGYTWLLWLLVDIHGELSVSSPDYRVLDHSDQVSIIDR